MDNHVQVRRAFYNGVYELIVNLNIVWLKENEAKLVVLLMKGAVDEDAQLEEECLNWLKMAGEYCEVTR